MKTKWKALVTLLMAIALVVTECGLWVIIQRAQESADLTFVDFLVITLCAVGLAIIAICAFAYSIRWLWKLPGPWHAGESLNS